MRRKLSRGEGSLPLIVQPDMEDVANSVLTGDAGHGRYSYPQMMEDIEILKSTYTVLSDSGMMTVGSVGQSGSGREIPVIFLGNRQAGYKLCVRGTAQNALFLMKQIEYYCANMNSGFSGSGRLEEQALQDTFENAAIAFVPMADPDTGLTPEGALSSGESSLETVDAFMAREQFNLLLEYRFGGEQSVVVSAPEGYGAETEEAQQNFQKLSADLTEFIECGKMTADAAGFARIWETYKDASLFLLRCAAEKELVKPIDRSMDIRYESVVDREHQVYDYYDLRRALAAMERRYAELVKAGKAVFTTVGKTELGRDIPAVIIGNRNAEHKLFVMGNEHAREDINARLISAQIELYLEMLQNHSRMLWQWDYRDKRMDISGVTWGDVFENGCIAMVPTANPDGLQAVHHGKASLYDADCTAMTDGEKAEVWENFEKFSVKLYANLKRTEGFVGGEIIDPDALNQQVFYTAEGKPYNPALWKSNIKGIDIFYNFYDWKMYNLGSDLSGGKLTTLSSYLRSSKTAAAAGKRVDRYAPSYGYSYGWIGMTAAETKAIAEFVVREGFNMAMTYHNRGPVLLWDYRLGTYYPPDSGVDGAAWAQRIRETCMEIARPSGYPVAIRSSLPAGFVAWFQTSHENSFAVNVESGRPFCNQVYDASPLRVAQFGDIWAGNQYGPMIALTHCLYNREKLVPCVSEYKDLTTDFWPDFTVRYSWAGEAPEGAELPVCKKVYTVDDYMAGRHLDPGLRLGYEQRGSKDGTAGVWVFNGWECNGWLRGQAVMDYAGSWTFRKDQE